MSSENSNMIRAILFNRRRGGLGFEIKRRDRKPYAVVSEVVPYGCAHDSGHVEIGDVIMRINDIDVSKTSFDSIKDILNSLSINTVVIIHLQGPTGFSTALETWFPPTGGSQTKRVTRPLHGNDVTCNGTNGVTLHLNHINKNGLTNGHVNGFTDNASTVDVDRRKPKINGYQDVNKAHETNGNHVTQNHVERPPMKVKRFQKLRYLENEAQNTNDTLHMKAVKNPCTTNKCMGSILQSPPERGPHVPRPREELIAQARDLIDQYYSSIKKANSAAHAQRWEEVQASILQTGAYDLSYDELLFGAKTAWRNAARCIGRIQWSKLQLFDARHITTAKEMFDAICNHLKYASNGGNIRSTITVFPPRTDGKHDFRVWNKLLVHYAGYRQPDGSIIGDPAHADFTEVCQALGWRGKGGRFDVLPIVVSAQGEDPEMFEVPPELALEVAIKHPKYDWFADLGYRWYGVPAIADMMLDVGGLEFTACPFNGWYMGTEVGCRDLCDATRYNIIEEVAHKMGLDTKTSTSLWKDSVLVEVNIAVLHSYQAANVTMMDHHQASASFMKHMENEQRVRGGCPADWVWVVPPMSASLCPVFHQEMLNYSLKPSYEYTEKAWTSHVWKNQSKIQSFLSHRTHSFKQIALAVMFTSSLMKKVLARRYKCTVLYATETGKSETFAKTVNEIFKFAFDTKVICMDEYDVGNLANENLVLVVASTFGNGDPPENGEEFSRHLYGKKLSTERKRSLVAKNGMRETWKRPLSHIKFSVCGLGSTAYPNFCAFGASLDQMFAQLGGKRIHDLAKADELCGEDDTFNSWARGVFKCACDAFSMTDDVNMELATAMLSADNTWSAEKYRLSPEMGGKEPELIDALSKMHRKKIVWSSVESVSNLQSPKSSRETLLVKLDTGDNTELSYVPGDHVGIFPRNDEKMVEALLDKLSDVPDAEQIVNLEMSLENSGSEYSWRNTERFPASSLRTAFTHYLDITTTPHVKMLQLLTQQATDAGDRERLTLLAKDPSAYEEWKLHKTPTLLEVLEEFPSIVVPATLLMSSLPLLQQRFYSISSSPMMHPGKIHATVAVVRFRTEDGTGPVHHGVCSTYLSHLSQGDRVACYIRSAPSFRLPDDSSLPVIMVGPGTGIAPFRSFWQQRAYDRRNTFTSKRWGEMSLYFGCRQHNVDDIFRQEIEQARQDGVLNEAFIALSRDAGSPKTYVQDHIQMNAAKIYKLITSKDAHFYVCGDVTMAADVTTTLQSILERQGEMEEEVAKDYIFAMRKEHRFHEDIFGVTFRKPKEKESSQHDIPESKKRRPEVTFSNIITSIQFSGDRRTS